MRYSLFPRHRTFYSHDADYTKPLFELTPGMRHRMMMRLSFLYGESLATAVMPELERILKVHCAHKPKEMIQKEQEFNPAERFSERDMILITYGDMVRFDGATPLKSLYQFVEACNYGVINTIHILPFFPYSSDRGFAIVDYKQVDPKLGTWDDIHTTKQKYDLMFDAVLNHCSAQSEMFREYRNGNPLYENFFIAYDSADELTPDQRSKIFRPRTSDILTRVDTLRGPKYVWTTFSADQIDLNFRNPEVLMRVIDGLLFYVRRGADILRLDAVTYIWAEPGTECAHLPQTHEIVKLLRDVVDTVASGVALVTETNVPHADNISYFGDGEDEAHMAYNFALPPLVLHTFYTGDATVIARWAEGLNPPSHTTAFFNILDTHDGIGLLGAKDILTKEQMDSVIATAMRCGAYVSYKMTETHRSEPYEINATWWSALNNDGSEEDISLQIKRYVASRSLALSIRGVPGIYIHGCLGSTNDQQQVAVSGIYRDVNRGYIDAGAVFHALEQSGSKPARIREARKKIELVRTSERAFHPNGAQRILMLSPRVFAVLRSSPEEDRHVLALTNVSSLSTQIVIPSGVLPNPDPRWEDLLRGRQWTMRDHALAIGLEPYEILWLKPQSQSSPAL